MDAAQCLPMLLFSRRAGIIVARHRAARIAMVTQALQAAGSLAIGVPLLAGWMTIWYLVPLSFVIGCVQCVDLPARQTFMLDLVGQAELRRGTSLFATITGLAKIAGPGVAGIIIAATGETAVFFIDAVSFLGVIAVLAWLSGNRPGFSRSRTGAPAARAPATRSGAPIPARRFRWLLDLPRGVRAAAAMALLVGGFGLQFAVTNPLMATRVFHLGPFGFGLFGTFMAVGGIAGSYYSSRRHDPGQREFLAWALVFGAAECLAAVMPAAWAYDAVLVVLGAATQLFASQRDRLRPAGHAARPARASRSAPTTRLHRVRAGRRVRRRRDRLGRRDPLGADRPRAGHPRLRPALIARAAPSPPGRPGRAVPRKRLMQLR